MVMCRILPGEVQSRAGSERDASNALRVQSIQLSYELIRLHNPNS